jgi:hypothetical protein
MVAAWLRSRQGEAQVLLVRGLVYLVAAPELSSSGCMAKADISLSSATVPQQLQWKWMARLLHMYTMYAFTACCKSSSFNDDGQQLLTFLYGCQRHCSTLPGRVLVLLMVCLIQCVLCEGLHVPGAIKLLHEAIPSILEAHLRSSGEGEGAGFSCCLQAVMLRQCMMRASSSVQSCTWCILADPAVAKYKSSLTCF